jgi:hypothetical protein
MLINFRYYIALIYRNNIFRGIYYHFRRRLINILPLSATPDRLFPIKWFSDDEFYIYTDYFKSNKSAKKKLIQIADDFLNNEVWVYNKKVNLYEYKVSNVKEKQKNTEVFHKDLRFYWEIYRDRFVYNICLAYKITGEEAYAKKLLHYIKDWKTFSPIESDHIPYNGMECAIKVMNLSWMTFFLDDLLEKDEEAKNALNSCIFRHASYIYKHYDITLYGLESNHGLSCSIGLIFSSFLFSNSPVSKKWYKLGSKTLKRGLKKQFSKEGVNFESSAQYHRFVFEMLTILLGASFTRNSDITNILQENVQKIGQSLDALTHTNHNISRIGDSDGGKFFYDLGSIEEFNKLHYLNWLSGMSENKYYETLIFNNFKPLKSLIKIKTDQIVFDKYASSKTKNLSLIASCNSIGTTGKGNHQHNDFGAFELYGEQPFIVDPWSYCYTGSKELRNNDRKTSSHNSIMINNDEIVPFEPNDLFEFKGFIRTSVNAEVKDSDTRITFNHNGYERICKKKNGCNRTITFDTNQNKIRVVDIVYGKDINSVSASFHIPKKYWDHKVKNNIYRFYNEKEEFTLTTNWDSVKIENSWCSEHFLNRVEAYNLVFIHQYKDEVPLSIEINYKNHSIKKS